MTDDLTTVFARIDRALGRIDRAMSAPIARDEPAADSRYDRLRERTQAALAQLDGVIARVSRDGGR